MRLHIEIVKLLLRNVAVCWNDFFCWEHSEEGTSVEFPQKISMLADCKTIIILFSKETTWKEARNAALDCKGCPWRAAYQLKSTRTSLPGAALRNRGPILNGASLPNNVLWRKCDVGVVPSQKISKNQTWFWLGDSNEIDQNCVTSNICHKTSHSKPGFEHLARSLRRGGIENVCLKAKYT